MQPRDRLSAREIEVATLVWQGLTNKEVARAVGASEQVVKNQLRSIFDWLGVWSRLELALYVASHGGANWHASAVAGNPLSTTAWEVPAAGETPVPAGEKRAGATSLAAGAVS